MEEERWRRSEVEEKRDGREARWKRSGAEKACKEGRGTPHVV